MKTKTLWGILAGIVIAALGSCAGPGRDTIPTAGRRETTVKREGDRVWIEGVGRPRGTNSVLASLAAVLQARGQDVTYEHLMGVSGRAFRLQFSWCPSAPHSYCGFNTFEPALKAMGYTATPYALADYKAGKTTTRPAAEVDKARQAVRTSIDAGRACLFGSEEESVLVGYEPSGEANATGWLALPASFVPPKDGELLLQPVQKLPWGVTVIAKAAEPAPPRRESVLWSLRTAVANARRDRIGEKPMSYAMGFAAWDKWIRELSGEQKLDWSGQAKTLEELDKDQWFSACLGNAWCYESLVDARSCAAKYLRSVTGELGGDAAGHLKAAADHYDQVAKTLTPECFTIIAPYPWMIQSDRTKWTPEVRKRQAGLMRDALAAERQAIAEIDKAIAAEGAEAVSPDAQAARAGKRLEGLQPCRNWLTLAGCTLRCMEYLKIDASPQWVYGGMGLAFALNVHDELCPSGPTAWADHKCHPLAGNLGARIAGDVAFKDKGDFAAGQERIWMRVREAIDAGHPAAGWEMNVPDWYVLCGYDDSSGEYLYLDFDGTVRRLGHRKLGDTGIGVACVITVQPGKPADDRTTVRQALQFALDNAAGKHVHNDKYHAGPAGYDTWIKALGGDKLATQEGVGFGCAYNAACWAECRRMAVGFLQEARKRLDDRKLDAPLDEAIARYAVVADKLEAVAKTFPFDVRDKKGMAERIKDPARRAKAVAALTAARDAEQAGLKALAQVAAGLEERPAE